MFTARTPGAGATSGMHAHDSADPAMHAARPRLLPIRRRQPTGRVYRDLLGRAVVDAPRSGCWRARRVCGGKEDNPERSQAQTHATHAAQAAPRATLTRNTRMVFRRVAKSHQNIVFFNEGACICKFVKTKTVEDGSRALVALSAAQPQPDGGRELFWAQCHCTVAMEAYVAERRVSCRALQPDSTGVSCLSMCAVPCLGQTHGGAYGDMPVCD